MGKVIASITTSVDGFVTGPDDGPEYGLGKGGERLHYWVMGGPWTYDGGHDFAMHGPDKECYDELVVELLVGAMHREVVTAVVGPRAAHHPVVQALSALAQAVLGSVIWSGDETVDRRGDGCDDLAHGSSSVVCREDRPDRGRRLIASVGERAELVALRVRQHNPSGLHRSAG